MFKIQHACWKSFVFGAILYTDSKWRFFIFQSIQGLCKMSHDNPMMIKFIKDKMTLKTFFLLYDPIITINVLVSCVTSPEKRFRPSIILTTTSVTFSTNAKLCHHTNSLSMKHVNALESKNVWVHTIMDLPPLIVMGNRKQGVGYKDKVRSF